MQDIIVLQYFYLSKVFLTLQSTRLVSQTRVIFFYFRFAVQKISAATNFLVCEPCLKVYLFDDEIRISIS